MSKCMALLGLCLALAVLAGEPVPTPPAQPKADDQPAAAAAQPADPKPADGKDLPVILEETVVTASREGQSRWEVPVAMGHLSHREIQEKQPTHPAELLGRVSGVWVNVTGGEGHMTAIRQPLTTSPVYLYLENGVPTRSTGFFNHNALYEVNLPMADSVEIIKGPGTALHGSDAIGGVVNVNSRAVPGEREFEASLEGGSYGYKRLLFSTGDALGSGGYRIDANTTQTDGWRDATGYERQSANLTWEHQTESTHVRALLAYGRIRQDTAGSSSLTEADFLDNPTRNLTPISVRNVDALRLSVAIDHLIGERGVLSIIPFARDNRMELLPNWSLSYDPTIYTTANTSLGTLVKYRLDLAPMRTRLIVGADFDYSPGDRQEDRLTTTRVDGVYTDYVRAATVYDYDVDFLGTSAYAQADFSPIDSLRIDAGLRYDRMSYDYTTHLAATATGRWRVPEDSKVDYDKVSPKFGLSWRPTDALNLFASYRYAFRAPAESQLFRQGSADDTLHLKPVSADNIDLGARGKLGQRFQYELTAYRLRKEDDILNYQDPVSGLRTSVNAGETLHRGLELDLDIALLEQLTARVSVSEAKHTYETWQLDGTTSYSGNEMETAPRTIANLALDYRASWLGGGPLSLEWQKLGSYWMDAANSAKYEGHDLFSLAAHWQLSDHLVLQGTVRNLTDERYAESTGYTIARGREYAPGQPRNFTLALRSSWK